jgi:hypothetical protein
MPSSPATNLPPLTEAELAALEERIAYSLRTGLGLPATIDEFQRLIAEVRAARASAARHEAEAGVCYCVGCGNAYREDRPPPHGPSRE